MYILCIVGWNKNYIQDAWYINKDKKNSLSIFYNSYFSVSRPKKRHHELKIFILFRKKHILLILNMIIHTLTLSFKGLIFHSVCMTSSYCINFVLYVCAIHIAYKTVSVSYLVCACRIYNFWYFQLLIGDWLQFCWGFVVPFLLSKLLRHKKWLYELVWKFMTLLTGFIKQESLAHFVRKIEEMNNSAILTIAAIKFDTLT
jgi:hypothetical protein